MASFDAYHKWLGISPAEQPADHYRLLGLSRFEHDPEVIRDAAERQMAHVRRYALGRHGDLSQRILNELGAAKACLLDDARRAAYDGTLRQPATHAPSPPAPESSAPSADNLRTIEQNQRLQQEVAALRNELAQLREPRVDRVSHLSRLTDWILSNAVKIAIVVILGGFLFLALFTVSGPLKEPETNVANDVTEEQANAAEDQPAGDKTDTENTSPVEQPAAIWDQQEDKEQVVDATAEQPLVDSTSSEPDEAADDKEEVVDATADQPVVDSTLSEPGDTVPATIESESAPPEVTTDSPAMAIAPFNEKEAKQHQQRWADYLGTPVEIPSDSGIKMVLIPPGEFLMGSPESEPGRRDNETQHLVRITKPFYFSAHEVTQQQYESVMQVRPWKGKDYVKEGPGYPATYVSWHDAVAFCDELSKMEGEEYRLPTEAQWEYACRAETTTARSFGGDASQLGKYAWYRTNARGVGEDYAHPVGEKKPNPWALYDMHGNVLEWCQDRDGPYESLQVVSDPTGPASGSSRVLRGGAFHSSPKNVCAALRDFFQPGYRNLNAGFRLTRTYNLSPAVTGPRAANRPASPAKDRDEAISALENLGARIKHNDWGEVVAVYLSYTKVTDTGLVHLKGLTNLETLDLSKTPISDGGLMRLRELTNLTGIRLDDTQITNAGLASLKVLTKLQWLDLRDTQITAAGVAQLQKALPNCRIEHSPASRTNAATAAEKPKDDPQLDSPHADDAIAALEKLGAQIQRNDRGKVITVRLNNVEKTDAGLVHLRSLASLRHLYLTGQAITDASLVHLEELTRLQRLYLHDTRVTDAGVAKLKKAIPRCNIRR